MSIEKHRRPHGLITSMVTVATLLSSISVFAQTKIVYHANKYQPYDDVKLGQQAAQQAERQLPVLRDREATDYLSRVGQRLVAAIPPEFQHSEFHYYFKIVNVSDINAFALPGGPMFVNRGTILAAHNEGELAGVMAHELSHVALRHGTAQATKAEKYSLLAGLAGIAGTIVAGPAAGQLAQAPVVGYFLHYSREYETEADLLGARIMSRAGYDPHDLANMFKTIERVSGSGGGGWFSDHPNPKNRYEKINQEAQFLRVDNPNTDNTEFRSIQERLRGGPRALSSQEVARNGRRSQDDNGRYPTDNGEEPRNDRRDPDHGRYPDNRRDPDSPPLGRVSNPSSRYQLYSELGQLRVKVPDNWREIRDNDSVWFAPEGAYGQSSGQQVFTHAINFKVASGQGQSLRAVNDQMVRELLQSKSRMRQIGRSQGSNTGTRYWMRSEFTNVNEATGRTENIVLSTTTLRSGEILFISTVVPQEDDARFQSVFANILNSLQLTN
jgi:hypothetical protein